ncbi:MAG: hypothetical protein AAF627_10420 [Myxococcota bacterium]
MVGSSMKCEVDGVDDYLVTNSGGRSVSVGSVLRFCKVLADRTLGSGKLPSNRVRSKMSNRTLRAGRLHETVHGR